MEPNYAGYGSSSKGKGLLKTLLCILFAVIFAGGVAYGVYLWQEDRLKQEKQNLQGQIDTLKAQESQSAQNQEKPKEFTYSPKTGGLTLKLPTTYAVVTSVDGNKGGAPGARFKVAKVTSDNVMSDNVNEWLQIDVDPYSDTIDQSAQVLIAELTKDRFTDIKMTDAKVANLAAKHITAKGVPVTAGLRSIYVMKSGEFTYTLTSKSTADSAETAMLQAALSGLTIVPKTLR